MQQVKVQRHTVTRRRSWIWRLGGGIIRDLVEFSSFSSLWSIKLESTYTLWLLNCVRACTCVHGAYIRTDWRTSLTERHRPRSSRHDCYDWDCMRRTFHMTTMSSRSRMRPASTASRTIHHRTLGWTSPALSTSAVLTCTPHHNIPRPYSLGGITHRYTFC